MKYVPSIAFDEMSGSAKGVTAAKVRGRKYIRNRGYGGSTRSTLQASVKSVFKELSQAWKNLTQEQIVSWNTLAQTQAGKSVLGTSARITGSNLFMRLNYWVVYCGGEIMVNPPTLQGVEAPAEAIVNLTPAKFTFELEKEPALPGNLKLIVQASAPQSNGISNAYSKASQIGNPLEPAIEEYDLKEVYDAKYGIPTTASPKVFIKYFFVNTATGEKSGDMMALASLAEDAQAGE